MNKMEGGWGREFQIVNVAIRNGREPTRTD